MILSDDLDAFLATGADVAALDAVRQLLNGAEGSDHLAVKIAVDRMIDPTTDATWVRSEIERLVGLIGEMLQPAATPVKRLACLRHCLFDAGPWNDHRPFAYDHSDPTGEDITKKLLANYLRTRRGNCISMPLLFLILAERLGLDVTLARAPLHVLVRYRAEDDRTFNIETTSGGHPARDDWYLQTFAITDDAIANGVYLRSLDRIETAVVIAGTLLEHWMQEARYRDAILLCDALLRHDPRDVYVMVKQGTCWSYLTQAEFGSYAAPFLISPPLQLRYRAMMQRNEACFAAAEARGWTPVE